MKKSRGNVSQGNEELTIQNERNAVRAGNWITGMPINKRVRGRSVEFLLREFRPGIERAGETLAVDNCNRWGYLKYMRTSCRFAMAVHVLALLAYKEGDRVTSAFLAGSVNTNPVIVRRLLLALQRARLVDTRKGAGSGSRLNYAPGRINLAQVYRAVEDAEPFGTPTRRPNAACPVGHCMREELEKIFVSAERALERDLGKTTLADLMEAVRACRRHAGKK
jgi:DNA-binding IscR family transcriptional regulator